MSLWLGCSLVSSKEKFDEIWSIFEAHIKEHGTQKIQMSPDSYAFVTEVLCAENH